MGPKRCFSIRGRATTSWTIEDPDRNNERVFLKDYWRAEDRIKVSVFLVIVKQKDVEGVCHHYEYAERGGTKVLEFHGGEEPEQPILHRYETRVTMKAYGPMVNNFTSPKQMLEVLRDAINGEC